MKKVIIIGGGPAGMMSAIGAAEMPETKVVLIEKNEKLGKKLYITGKGRCNVTNACDIDTFFSNIISNKKFMYSAAYSYTAWDVMDTLENLGCPLKVERGNRVFPVSDHASDVTGALNKRLKQLGVEILLDTEVKKLEIRDNQVRGVYIARRRESDYLTCDSLIVATGGLSYSSTGSTGDGFRFAKECGHDVTACQPALVPFNCEEDWCSPLSGLSLKNVTLTLIKEGQKKPLYSDMGEMLFTHFGISGPLVLSASSYLPADRDFGNDSYYVSIDLKPALKSDRLDEKLINSLKANPGKAFKNAIHDWLPAKLIPVVINQAGIDEMKKTDVITREDRKAFVDAIKGLRLHITDTRTFSEAIITKGGVNVKEIDPSTCQSKLIKGLYFAGEVMDLDALTGGHNLQIAWSTGHLAGVCAGT